MENHLHQEIDKTEVLFRDVPLQVAGAATLYAGALALGERRLPIKPNYIWMEVAGGVLLTLLPLAYAARRVPAIDGRMYEQALWRCFLASGAPIILWQLIEQIFRTPATPPAAASI